MDPSTILGARQDANRSNARLLKIAKWSKGRPFFHTYYIYIYIKRETHFVKCKRKSNEDKKKGYPSTLANLTLIILFSKMLKFSNFISSKSKNIFKNNSEYLGIFHLLKWNFQARLVDCWHLLASIGFSLGCNVYFYVFNL